jgi:hypothetical protein
MMERVGVVDARKHHVSTVVFQGKERAGQGPPLKGGAVGAESGAVVRGTREVLKATDARECVG